MLLLEDDPFMSSLLAEGMGQEGLEVMLARNAEEALRQFREAKPDVLVVDILLPGGRNGLEALREIRALPGGEKMPALVLSNLEEPGYVAEAQKLGVAAYLVKANLEIPEIVAKVKEALGKAES